MNELKEKIVSIKDFPKKGIMYRDITSLLENKYTLKQSIDAITSLIGDKDFDIIIGPESRGFIFGMPVAYNLNKAFVPVRKKGKLPRETVSVEYDLEYGTEVLEMHKDSIKKGDKVIIIDDLIATGGTTEAIIKMVNSLGGEVVGVYSLIELTTFKVRNRIKNIEIKSYITYDGE